MEAVVTSNAPDWVPPGVGTRGANPARGPAIVTCACGNRGTTLPYGGWRER